MNILITGAAGNMGSHIGPFLFESNHQLKLVTHRSPLPYDINNHKNVCQIQADLGNPETLDELCKGMDCIIHLAGVLFRPHPEKFLSTTNTEYVKNLVQAAKKAKVAKFILLSFPHVEGETTPDDPANGTMNGNPTSIHAQTRLAAEKYLIDTAKGTTLTPIILRAGIVYGKNLKLIKGAYFLSRLHLLAIWKKPTWMHLIAMPDLLKTIQVAIDKKEIEGVYNICDDKPILVQDFLDRLATHWGHFKPWRFPLWVFNLSTLICEKLAAFLGTATPLHKDIMKMGLTSSVADISRMKRELLPTLQYPTLNEGLELL